MNPKQAEAVNGCIGLSALAVGAVAIVIGIATRDWRSALVTGLCLLGLAMTASLYMALGEWDALGLYSMVAAICAFALFALQTNRNEEVGGGDWHGFGSSYFMGLFSQKRSNGGSRRKIAGILALLFAGVGLFFLLASPV